MIVNLKPISTARKSVRPQTCALPKRCVSKPDRPFNEIMDSKWEELVIFLDKDNNKYRFKTACCPGAPAC